MWFGHPRRRLLTLAQNTHTHTHTRNEKYACDGIEQLNELQRGPLFLVMLPVTRSFVRPYYFHSAEHCGRTGRRRM